ERQRKAADDCALRIFEFRRRHLLVTHTIELVHELLHRAFSNVCANFRARLPDSAKTRTAEAAVRAVGVALVFAKIQEQSSGWTTAENAIGQQHCEVVRAGALDSEGAELQHGLDRVWTIDQQNARR